MSSAPAARLFLALRRSLSQPSLTRRFASSVPLSSAPVSAPARGKMCVALDAIHFHTSFWTPSDSVLSFSPHHQVFSRSGNRHPRRWPRVVPRPSLIICQRQCIPSHTVSIKLRPRPSRPAGTRCCRLRYTRLHTSHAVCSGRGCHAYGRIREAIRPCNRNS
jgi:hypothetical protein